MEIELSSDVLLNSLLGKTNLLMEYALSDEDEIVRALNEGWQITSCQLKARDIETGEPSRIVLSLVPPFDSVFGGKGKGN